MYAKFFPKYLNTVTFICQKISWNQNTVNWFHEKTFAWQSSHSSSVEITRTHYCILWKLRIFTATVVSQIFRQTCSSKEVYCKVWIDLTKKFACQRISRFSTNFSSNQRFAKELYCKLVWRKKDLVWENFSFLQTVEITEFYCNAKFRQTNLQ